MEGKEVYLKEDIVWAFDTFLGQLKSSEAIHPQTIRIVEHLKSQIVEIVPTHEVVSPWHTGTPTEEGEYVVETWTGKHSVFLFKNGWWWLSDEIPIPKDATDYIKAYGQKITPFEEMQKRFDTSQNQSSVQ